MNYILKCSILLLIGIIIYLLINNSLKIVEGFGPEDGPFYGDNIETINIFSDDFNLDTEEGFYLTLNKIQLDDQTRSNIESNSVTPDDIFYIDLFIIMTIFLIIIKLLIPMIIIEE